jgi:hypothetical protein
MSAGPIKLMYYAPLPAGRSRQEFRERWAQHGALAMSLPLWRHMVRYQQFDALAADAHGRGSPSDGAPATATFGGVGAVWVRDATALAAVAADPDNDLMRTDEVEAFGRPLGQDVVPCRPHNVVGSTAATVAVTVFGQVWRQPAYTREEFAARWLAHGEVIARTTGVVRHIASYVQNHALPESSGPDGFFEIGFGSLDALGGFFAETTLAAELAEREAEFARSESVELLVCAERRLFDESGCASAIDADASSRLPGRAAPSR